MRRLAAMVLACSILFAGCESPEATRTRGGGPGGDRGNRAAVVKMHEGSQPFWETPKRIPVNSVPLLPANQARDLSRQ
jgi:hypothetical protein